MTARIKVFLSHSSADKDLARRLARDLQSANVDVWLDQWEIGVGEEFGQRIEQGLEEVDFVIVLLTHASVASEWVDREWRHKVQHEAQTKRIAVVPVRGEPCEIPDFLAQRSYADISGGSYPLGFRHLLMILRHYADEASIEAPKGDMERKESSPTMVPVVTPITLEVGRELIPIFEPDSEGTNRALDELAPGMRNALRTEFGFPFPGIRVLGNATDMPPRCALILIDEVPEIMLDVGREDVLVDETVEGLAALGIKGEPRDDPATGRARARIAAANRAAAEAADLPTWDAAGYLFLALHAVIRRMAASFLDIDATRSLVDSLDRPAHDRAAEIVPKVMSWFELTNVLQRLVDEEINVSDVGRILEALSQRESDVVDTAALAERARHALRRQITAKFARGHDPLSVLLLATEIEALISSAIQRTSVGVYLALEPQLARDLLAAVRTQVNSLGARAAGIPVLVTTAAVRPFIRRLVSLEFPSLHVLSRQDLELDTQIQAIAQIDLGSASHDGALTKQGVSV
jgi:type III secretion protein V